MSARPSVRELPSAHVEVPSIDPLALSLAAEQKNSKALPSVYPVPHRVSSTRALGFIAFAALLVVAGLLALPAQPADVCLSADGRVDLCYCEVFRHGLVRQPINTLSSLAFPIAGIAMLWKTPTIQASARTRFHRDKRIHLVWALTCILLGPASIVYHATFLMLPGLFDDLAMLFWISLFAAYHTGRAFEWRGIRILGGFATMTVSFFGAAVIALVVAPEVNGPNTVARVAAGTAIVAPFLSYLRHGFPGWRSERWLAASFVCISLAFLTCIRSKTGEPWCVSDSWFQGHAEWHVLSAVGMWLAFEHARRTSP